MAESCSACELMAAGACGCGEQAADGCRPQEQEGGAGTGLYGLIGLNGGV